MKLLYKEELLSTGVKKVVKYVADDVDQPYYYRGVHDAIRCVKGSSTFYILDSDRSSYVVDDFSATVPFGFTTNRYTWDDVLDTFTINPDFDPTIFQRTVNYPVRINDVSDLALEVMGGGDFNRIRVTDSGVILGETDSINTSTGSFIVYGGVAVKKNLTIGDNLTIGGDLTVNGAVSFSTFGMNNNSPFTFKDTDGANLSFIVSASDMFSFNSTTSAGSSREIFKIQANNDTSPFIIGTDTNITSSLVVDGNVAVDYNTISSDTIGLSLFGGNGAAARAYNYAIDIYNGNFRIIDAGAAAERFSISTNGRSEFQGEVVSRSNNAFRMYSSTYGSFWRNDGSSTYLLITANGDPYGSWNALRPFTVNNSTGDVSMSNVTATSFNATSSRLLKDKILPYTDRALSIINNLDVVSYVFKSKPNETKIGLIAEDSGDIISPTHVSIDIGNTIAVLIKSIQELSDEVTRLKSKPNYE